MLGTTRKGTSLWIGAGAAILAVGLTGCGGSKKGSREGAAAAGVTSAATGGTTSGSIGGTTSGTTGGSTIPGGGTIGGGTIGGGVGGGGTIGGGGTTPGGTNPGGGGSSGGTAPGGVTDDHANNATGATRLNMGSPLTGAVQYAGDHDWFKVDLTSGVVYTFNTANLGAGMDSILRLIDAAGAQVADNDDETTGSLTSRFTYTPSANGTFSLVVLHKDATAATGTYSVAATIGNVGGAPVDDHKNDATTTSNLTLGTAVNGEIETSGDVDWFRVSLTAGTTYTLRTELPTGGDTEINFYDDAGNLLDHNDDDPNGIQFESRIDYPVTATGTYYVEVMGYNNTSMPIYLVVAEVMTTTGGGTGGGGTPATDDHMNDATTTSVLVVGTPANGEIETSGDQDWFKVDLVAGKVYEFRTDIAASSIDDDTYLRLWDAAGTTQLTYNDDEDFNGGLLNSKITYTATVTGPHFLDVRGFASYVPIYTLSAIDMSPTTNPPTTNPPTTPTNVAALNAVMWDDVDGSKDASLGDTLTLTFSEAVSVITIQPNPLPTLSPDTDFALPVAGDSFGANASWTIATPNSANVIITLGTAPVLRLTGTFDATKVAAGSASGLEVKATTTLSTASSSLAVQNGQKLDIGSNVLAGFFPGADMVQARGSFGATVMNDGRVLVTGGLVSGSSFAYKNEIYDPVANVWTEITGSGMGFSHTDAAGNAAVYAIGRFDHVQTLLADGRVLITGGRGFERATNDPTSGAVTPTIEELNSAFLFDPTTNMFEFAGMLTYDRESHYATLLPNGQVLISGGYNSRAYNNQGGTLPIAELFDPTTKTFMMVSSTGDDMVYPRESGTAHVVNGNVVHIGGEMFAMVQGGTQVQRFLAPDSEVFDVATGTSSAGAAMGSTRRWHAATQLASGDVIVFGGDIGSAATNSVEKFEAASNTFTAMGTLAAARARHGVGFVGADVLAVGGVAIDYTAGAITEVKTGELYNLGANVSESYQLGHARNSHRVVTLKTGKVMVIGGWENGLTRISGSDGVAVQGCEVFAKP